MNKIVYISGDVQLLDEVKELWEGLNEHHLNNTFHFSDYYSNFTFDSRKNALIAVAQKGSMKIEIAIDEDSQKKVGYLISSIDSNKNGEIESIYILNSYRGQGIGEELMKRALKWMDEKGIEKKIVTVAAGNEKVFGFYEKFGFYPRKMVLEQRMERR